MNKKSLMFASIGKVISGVVAFTLIGKMLGFLREILLSYYFGASGISDAYLISQNIPGSIFQFVAAGLTTCFVPVYFLVKNEKGSKEAKDFTDSIATLVFLFSIIVLIFVCLFTDIIVKLFASGFDTETMRLAVIFTRIGVTSLLFSAFLYVFNSFLQANNSFLPVAVSVIPYNFFLIIAIILGAKVHIYLLAVVSSIAVLIQLLFIIPTISKFKYKYNFKLGFDDAYVISFFKLLMPVLVGVSINELNTLIDKTIASQVAVGGISALVYATSLINLIQGGLVQPVAMVFYPKITQAVTAEDGKSIKSQVEGAINTLLTFLIPITIGMIILARPIVKVLFGHGVFDENAENLTVMALRGYSAGICFVGVREIILRYYYACKNTKIPMINTGVGMFCNIFLNIILSKYIGILGLAIATSISSMLIVFLLWHSKRRLDKDISFKIEKIELRKTVVNSLIMGAGVYCVYTYLSFNIYINLFIAVLLGIGVYLLLANLTEMKYIKFMLRQIKK